MSNINDGGPAFPRDHASDGHNGMTLRDYFAAKLISGAWANAELLKVLTQDGAEALFIAKAAYEQADAMLKARGQ